MDNGLIGYLFIVVALIFIFGGAKRLEDLGKGFGGFLREFNKARRDGEKEVSAAIEAPKAPGAEETKPGPQG